MDEVLENKTCSDGFCRFMIYGRVNHIDFSIVGLLLASLILAFRRLLPLVLHSENLKKLLLLIVQAGKLINVLEAFVFI